MLRMVFSVTLSLFSSGCAVINSNVAEAQNDSVQPMVESEGGEGDLLFNILSAEISAQQGDHDAAYLYYLRATALSEHPEIAERSAKLSIHGANIEQTIGATQRWVEKDPDNIEARRILGALLLRGGDQQKAAEQFKQLIQLKGKDLLSGFQLVAEQLRKEPNAIAATQVLSMLVEYSAEDAAAWYVQGWYYSKKRNAKKALVSVDQALKIRPDWGRAVVLRVTILEMLGRADEVVNLLKQQVKRSPKDVDILQRYGKALISQKRNSEALQQFKKAYKLSPRSAEILSALALLEIDQKQFKRARKHLLQLREMNGQSDKANYYLGELEETVGNDQQAVEHYASVSHGMLHFNARVRMATLLAKDKVEKGLSILHGLTTHSDQQRTQLLLLEGGLLEDASRYQEAVKVYDQALELSPDNEEILYARAMAGDLAGDLALLERDLHTILDKNPKHYHAWNALGYTLTLRTERYAEAQGYLQKAMELRPKDFYVLDSMGWVLYKMGDVEQALKYLNRAFDANRDAEVAAHLGEVRWVSGDKGGAKEAWSVAKEIDKNNQILRDTLKRFSQK